MLFALGTVFVFGVGGLTGLFLGDISMDLYLHDTMFVVGHFHFTMAAGSFVGALTGVYFWFPKMFGRRLDERLGKAHFWFTLLGLTLVFGGQLLAGYAGQQRRLFDPFQYTFIQGLPASTAGRATSRSRSSPGQLFFVVNFFKTVFGRRAAPAGANPWQVTTLEWTATSSPPPFHNFDRIPEVVRGPTSSRTPRCGGYRRDFAGRRRSCRAAASRRSRPGRAERWRGHGAARRAGREPRRPRPRPRPVPAPTRGAERTAHVGMAVFLGSWAMLFVGLFFAYAFVRARRPAWPPLDAPPLPRLLPGLNTLAIAASSVAVVRAVRAQELGRAAERGAAPRRRGGARRACSSRSRRSVWRELWRAGLVPSGGTYGSVFYAFTAFHALHVLVGLAGAGSGCPPAHPRGREPDRRAALGLVLALRRRAVGRALRHRLPRVKPRSP